MPGKFQNNLAYLEFELHGIDKKTSQNFNGIIDTGFNGYLQIPMVQALPLGLKLIGVMPSTIANGQTVVSLMCEGFVTVEGKEIETIVYLQDGNTVLIGTQLLEKIGKNLILDFVDGTFEFKDRPKNEQKTIQTAN